MGERGDTILTPPSLSLLYRAAQVLATFVVIGLVAFESMMATPLTHPIEQISTWALWFIAGFYLCAVWRKRIE